MGLPPTSLRGAVVKLVMKPETWLDAALTSAVRLAAFYRNDDNKGSATKLLCELLTQHVQDGQLSMSSVIVAEADYSSWGGLERFYNRLGFRMVSRYLHEDDPAVPNAVEGGLMGSRVGIVLEACKAQMQSITGDVLEKHKTQKKRVGSPTSSRPPPSTRMCLSLLV